MIKLGIDINFQDNKGNTALMRACVYEHKKIVEILLAVGADIYITNNKGRNAIICACEGYVGGKIIRILIDAYYKKDKDKFDSIVKSIEKYELSDKTRTYINNKIEI